MGSGALTWLGDNALNGVAYLSLLVATPLRAKTWVKVVASLYPTIETIDEARDVIRRLGARGTCLSRSLSVAARCRGSQVVIGVVPPSRADTPRIRLSRWPIDAHAWVEIAGTALLDGTTPAWVEVGRLDVGGARKNGRN